jgi:hypothetical protein
MIRNYHHTHEVYGLSTTRGSGCMSWWKKFMRLLVGLSVVRSHFKRPRLELIGLLEPSQDQRLNCLRQEKMSSYEPVYQAPSSRKGRLAWGRWHVCEPQLQPAPYQRGYRLAQHHPDISSRLVERTYYLVRWGTILHLHLICKRREKKKKKGRGGEQRGVQACMHSFVSFVCAFIPRSKT